MVTDQTIQTIAHLRRVLEDLKALAEKAGWKKIAVSLPDALYARIRMRAVDENRSMSEMVARLAERGFAGKSDVDGEELRRTLKDAVDLLTTDPPRRLTAIKLLEDKLSAQKEDAHGDRPNDCP